MTYQNRKNLPFAQIINPTPMIMHIFESAYTVFLKTEMKIRDNMYVNLPPHTGGCFFIPLSLHGYKYPRQSLRAVCGTFRKRKNCPSMHRTNAVIARRALCPSWQSLPTVLLVGASIICLTSTPCPRHHYDAELWKEEIKKPSTSRRVITIVRIAESDCTPAMTH